MSAVHDGTPNINIRNVNNVKCVNCKNCINKDEFGFYWCMITDEVDYIEESIANDDNLPCEFYDEDSYDDITER